MRFILKEKDTLILYAAIFGILMLLSACVTITSNDSAIIHENTDENNENDECTKLSENFDSKISLMSPIVCDSIKAEDNSYIVGGILTSISKNYNNAYDRNEFTLTFIGAKKEGKLIIGSNESQIPYEVGLFYKYDLKNQCTLMRSMASSGLFYDPKLDALAHVQKCD